MQKIISADLYRYTDNCGALGFMKTYLKNRGFRYVFWLRLTKSKSFLLSNLARYCIFRMQGKFGIIIPRSVVIGPGLFIGHGFGVVINSSAVIGKNFNISQFCTIGSNHGSAARIGDNVYMGPNSCIVEDVKIGNNVTIGAGAVVTKDIPDNATVVGVPARVINFNNPGRYIKK